MTTKRTLGLQEQQQILSGVGLDPETHRTGVTVSRVHGGFWGGHWQVKIFHLHLGPEHGAKAVASAYPSDHPIDGLENAHYYAYTSSDDPFDTNARWKLGPIHSYV